MLLLHAVAVGQQGDGPLHGLYDEIGLHIYKYIIIQHA